ncbi:MAG: electron transfer flavoprotein subunit alpha/FixB family protein, partial [Geminicoccaceae bacterium]|nr:electron transfer flavoprotein subunit alpha/FixB family protein [Geminicoccaceae bacterium]
MAILVLAQHDGEHLDPSVLHAVTAAAKIGDDLHLLVAGKGADAVAAEAAAVSGVSKVVQVDHDAYANPTAEDIAPLLVSVAPGYSHLVAASTTFGRNVMPRASALLDSAQVSDIVDVVSADTYKRYIYAGNALTTVQCKDERPVLTVRTTAFDAA